MTTVRSTSMFTSMSNATTAVFDTVGNTAIAATKAIDGLSSGANAFHRMMSDMDKNHEMRSKLARADYERDLLVNTTKTIVKRELAINEEMAANPEFANAFKETYAELKLLLKPVVTE